MAKDKKTICIDFDGVLHDYSEGFKGKDVFGDMVPDADVATKLLKDKGWTVIIYTTRPKTKKLEAWLSEHKIAYDYINENPDQPEDAKGGKIIADLYLDDRGMCFRGRWDEWMMREIAEFRPWQKDTKKSLEKGYDDGEKWQKKALKAYEDMRD